MRTGLRLALALLVGLFAADLHAAETIKIGAVLSVTGPASFLGEPEKNTLEMIRDEINSAGGILGRKIELIVYDDETDVNKAVLAADKLLKKDEVCAVAGGTTSGNTLAITSKFNQAKIPQISLSASEKITLPVTPYVFKVAPSDRLAVRKILTDAKAKGYKKLAIITVSDGFGQSGREFLKELIPAEGFSLTADEVFGPKDTDMTAQLTKIKDTAPDAIICWGTNPGPAVIARNRAQLGIATPLYMSHGVASKKFIELAGESAEGLVLPAGALIVAAQLKDDNPQKLTLLNYAKQYEAKFGQSVSTFGGHGYDALKLFALAIENGKSNTPSDIRDNLEKIQKFAGVGGVFSFSPQDHAGLDDKAFVLVKIEKGDWKLLAE